MEILKNFVVFEGCDGSGTTTQLNILEDFFLHCKTRSMPPFCKTFEPTNGSIGKLIRQNLRKEITFNPVSMAFLFAADRSEHLYAANGVLERCKQGELVVCDRYILSSIAYQGIECGEELPERLNNNFPGPELLLFFDIDPEIAQKRMENRDIKEIYEYIDFQIEVRSRYKRLLPIIAGQGTIVKEIDASMPVEEVHKEVWSLIKELPIIKG